MIICPDYGKNQRRIAQVETRNLISMDTRIPQNGQFGDPEPVFGGLSEEFAVIQAIMRLWHI
jgi:hypothetical protein